MDGERAKRTIERGRTVTGKTLFWRPRLLHPVLVEGRLRQVEMGGEALCLLCLILPMLHAQADKNTCSKLWEKKLSRAAQRVRQRALADDIRREMRDSFDRRFRLLSSREGVRMVWDFYEQEWVRARMGRAWVPKACFSRGICPPGMRERGEGGDWRRGQDQTRRGATRTPSVRRWAKVCLWPCCPGQSEGLPGV